MSWEAPDDGRDLDRVVHLEAETAADIRRDHPDLVFRNEQGIGGKPAPQVVRRLRRCIERDIARDRIADRNVGPRLHRTAGDAVAVQHHLGHVSRLREGGFDDRLVAAIDLEHQVGAEIVVDHRSVRVERAGDVGDRGQRLVDHLYRLDAVIRDVRCLRDDRGDHIADMADLVGGEDRAQLFVHRPAIGKRHGVDAGQFPQTRRRPVRRGEDSEHTRQRGRGAGVDTVDLGVGVGAAHKRDPCAAGHLDVVDIVALAAQKPLVFAPPERLADIAHLGLPGF